MESKVATLTQSQKDQITKPVAALCPQLTAMYDIDRDLCPFITISQEGMRSQHPARGKVIRTFGAYWCHLNIIRINPRHLYTLENDVVDTFAHELAHWVQHSRRSTRQFSPPYRSACDSSTPMNKRDHFIQALIDNHTKINGEIRRFMYRRGVAAHVERLLVRFK